MIAVHVAIYLAFLLLLTWGGNHAVRLILNLSGKPHPPASEQPYARTPPIARPGGRFIGILERTLIFIGVAASSLQIMVAVIALKSVARYRDLNDRAFAEYFLIGSMASILWAILVTFAAIIYDRTWGLDLIASYLGFFG